MRTFHKNDIEALERFGKYDKNTTELRSLLFKISGRAEQE